MVADIQKHCRFYWKRKSANLVDRLASALALLYTGHQPLTFPAADSGVTLFYTNFYLT